MMSRSYGSFVGVSLARCRFNGLDLSKSCSGTEVAPCCGFHGMNTKLLLLMLMKQLVSRWVLAAGVGRRRKNPGP